MHSGRRSRAIPRSRRTPLQDTLLMFLLARVAFGSRSCASARALNLRSSRRHHGRLIRLRISHAHDLARHAVCLLLVAVAGLVHGELWLKFRPGSRQHAQHSLIAKRVVDHSG